MRVVDGIAGTDKIFLCRHNAEAGLSIAVLGSQNRGKSDEFCTVQ